MVIRMRKYGEDFEITNDDMDLIATYMDDDKRERVHMEIAPCTHEAFIKRYCEYDPEFEETLKIEFGVEL